MILLGMYVASAMGASGASAQDVAEAIRKKCCFYKDEYNMVPHVTWGHTPEDEKKWHSDNNCDEVMGGPELTNCPGMGSVTDCCLYHTKFGMIPHVTWGTTPEESMPWHTANKCDEVMGGPELTNCKAAGTADPAEMPPPVTPPTEQPPAEAPKTSNLVMIEVGHSVFFSKTVMAPIHNLRCPPVVNKDNWLGDETSGEEFSVKVTRNRVQVTRTDTVNGWLTLNLKFNCKPPAPRGGIFG